MRVLHILDQLGRCAHGRIFHGLANEILLVDGKISGSFGRAFVLSEGDHRLYSFHCLVRLGPLALEARACPLAVTDGGLCKSLQSEVESSSMSLRGPAFDDFNGDCWPSESDDESRDFKTQDCSSHGWHALHHLWFPRPCTRNISGWIREGSLSRPAR